MALQKPGAWTSELDPQARETFLRSMLSWEEIANAPHAEILAGHKKLIQLRRHEPALADDWPELVKAHFDETARRLAVERGPVTLLVNLAATPQSLPVRAGRCQLLLSCMEDLPVAAGGANLPDLGVAVLKQTESTAQNA